LTHKMSSNLNL